MVKDTIKKSREAAGPLGMNAGGWRRILISGNLENLGEEFRKSIAEMVQKEIQIILPPSQHFD